jgi:hypothetical protein
LEHRAEALCFPKIIGCWSASLPKIIGCWSASLPEITGRSRPSGLLVT